MLITSVNARQRLAVTLLGLLFFCLAATLEARALPVSIVAVEQAEAGVYLADFAFYLPDPLAEYSIEQAGAPLLQSRYAKLSEGLPLAESGVFWLRFSLVNSLVDSSASSGPAGPSASSVTGVVALRLQPGTPEASVYVAQELGPNGEVLTWREIAPQANGDFIFPDPRNLPLTVYAKFSGSPGLWFNPKLVTVAAGAESTAGEVTAGTAAESAFDKYSPLLLQLLLGLCLFICLLRGVSRHEEWRLWAGAVIGCALVQALFYRQAAYLGEIYLTALPQLLAPGLTIMLIPHLGRHLLKSRGSRSLDLLLLLLSLPGMAVALAPLLPGFEWTAKLLPLAPLLLLPLLLPALAALFGGRSGAFTYLLICLLPLLGALFAGYGLLLAGLGGTGGAGGPGESGTLTAMLYQYGPDLSLWGYALAALLMALAAPGGGKALGEDVFPLHDDDGLSIYSGESFGGNNNLEIFGVGEARPRAVLNPAGSVPAEPEVMQLVEADAITQIEAETIFNLEPGAVSDQPDTIESMKPEADLEQLGLAGKELVYISDPEEPGLVIIKAREPLMPANAPESGKDSLNIFAESSSLAESARHPRPAALRQNTAVRRDLPELSFGAAPVAESSLADSFDNLRQNLEDLKRQQSTAESMTDNLEDILHGLGLALNNLDRLAHGQEPSGQPAQSIFNLSGLVRRVHAETLPVAEARGVTLSWFVSPLLPVLYKGDEDALHSALSYMLRGSVEAAEAGAVQLAVRQAKPAVAGGAASGDGPLGGAGPLTSTGSLPDAEQLGGAGPLSSGLTIQFSLIDSGMSPHSLRRPARVLSRAWELAKVSQGSFSIEYEPDSGTSINFSLCLMPLSGKDNAWAGNEKLEDLASRAEASESVPATDPVGQSESDVMPEPQQETPVPAEPAWPLTVQAVLWPQRAAAPGADEPESAAQVSELAESVLAEPEVAEPVAAEAELAEPVMVAEAAGPEPAAMLSELAESVAAEPELAEPAMVAEVAESLPVPDAIKEGEGLSMPATAGGEDALPVSASTQAPTALPVPDEDLLVLTEDEVLAPADEVLAPVEDILAPVEAESTPSQPASPALDLIYAKTSSILRTLPPDVVAERDSIVIADMAASGRRIIARRLESLPHKRLEARTCQEIIRAAAGHKVALIIVDADIPEADLRSALYAVNAAEAASGRPPVPSLGLVSHASQMERLRKTGCTVCQVKTESRESFQREVLRLAPWPGTEVRPEAEEHNSLEFMSKSVSATESPAATGRVLRVGHNDAHPDRSVPMLDLLVSGLDAETAEASEKNKILLSGSDNDYMKADMLQYVPDFLVVLKDALIDLSAATSVGDAALVCDLAGRMEKQGCSYGLNNLERMAACVKRAAAAGDQEAIRDLAGELVNLVRRYLPALRITYDDNNKP